MVLVVLFILKYLLKWFFKALFFIGGVVCIGIGGINLIRCIGFVFSGVSYYMIPVVILTSLFNIAVGILFFWLVFHKWDKKKASPATETASAYNNISEVKFSPELEELLKKYKENN